MEYFRRYLTHFNLKKDSFIRKELTDVNSVYTFAGTTFKKWTYYTSQK